MVGRGTCGSERSSLSRWCTWSPGHCVHSRDVQSAEKKKVSKFTKYFNTLKDQEAMLFHEWHSVSKVPKTILQFSCFLEGFTKIIKAVTLLFYYNEMMLIKISKRKRRIEQSSGESKHMFSSACAVI